MKLPSEELYDEWQDIFFQNIDQGFQGDEMVDYLEDRFDNWLGAFYDCDDVPSYRQILKFAWRVNMELVEKEMAALSKAKGD